MNIKINKLIKLLKLLIIFTFIIAITSSCSGYKTKTKEPYIEAKVLNIVSSITILDEKYNIKTNDTKISLEILNGEEKGKQVEITQRNEFSGKEISIPNINDIVIISEINFSDDTSEFQIIDYKRTNTTWTAFVLFSISLILLGGIKGVIIFGYLILVFTLIIYILFPLIANGWNSIILTLLLSFIISLLINFSIHSTKIKFKKAIISNFSTLTALSILAFLFAKWGHFDSLISQESIMSLTRVSINPTQFIASAIILTSLGGIISVSYQNINNYLKLKKSVNEQDFLKFFILSIRTSRPFVFTNIIFILLIYLGLTLPVLISKYNSTSVQALINIDVISFYIITTSIGCIGIMLSNVITSLLSTLTFINEKEEKHNKKTTNLSLK